MPLGTRRRADAPAALRSEAFSYGAHAASSRVPNEVFATSVWHALMVPIGMLCPPEPYVVKHPPSLYS